MIARVLMIACALAVALVTVSWAFAEEPRPVGLALWHVHLGAAVVCGVAASVCISWRRPFLYAVFITTALFIPVFGPVFVLLLGILGRSEGDCRPVPGKERFACGIPLRESRRRGEALAEEPFVARFRALGAAELEAELSDLVNLDNAPLASLNRAFRDHSDTRVRLVGQACLADRLNRLDAHVRGLEGRLARNAADKDALLGLCELHLSILEQCLVPLQDQDCRSRMGVEWARRLGSMAGARMASAYYEARFALQLNEIALATGAWARLVDLIEHCGVVNPGDRYHLLGAEIALARGDLHSVCQHVARLEPDTGSKYLAQEFWLEPAAERAS